MGFTRKPLKKLQHFLFACEGVGWQTALMTQLLKAPACNMLVQDFGSLLHNLRAEQRSLNCACTDASSS